MLYHRIHVPKQLEPMSVCLTYICKVPNRPLGSDILALGSLRPLLDGL